MAEMTKTLHNYLKEIANEQEYDNATIDIQAITSGGANFSSTLYVATISSPPKEDLRVFAKVFISGENEATNDIFTLGFNTERTFYSELAVAFEKLYNRCGVPEEDRLYISKYFGYKTNGNQKALVLENLAAKGFGSFDRFQSFDLEYATKSIEELAKFHALGLAYRKENQERLEEIGREFAVDATFIENVKKMLYEQTVKMGTQVVKEEYRSRLAKYFEENDLLDAITKCWYTPRATYLIHGDYRPNNLMHRRHNGKLEVVPLDYQTIRLCTMAADLVYFLWLGSDSEFRQKHYHQLLKYYYKELESALKKLQVDIDEVYSRNVFEQELEDTKALGLFLGLSMTNLLVVAPENAPVLDKTENMLIDANQMALDRMNGIIEDCIRWKII